MQEVAVRADRADEVVEGLECADPYPTCPGCASFPADVDCVDGRCVLVEAAL
jgi:hypothetical protein